MKRIWAPAAFGLLILCANTARSQEPQTQPQQGTQFSTGADPKEQAVIELNRGVRAFKDGLYDAALNAFKHAKELDPALLNARLYLATTYATQYIPGVPSEENRQMGTMAMEEFKGVLELEPGNLSALDGAGSIAFQMSGTPYRAGQFLQSKTYFLKHIQIKPDDPEPYYWVGVIDWTLSFRGGMETRRKYNEEHTKRQINDADPLPEAVRAEYARQYGTAIAEGIESLRQAIELKPDYDDAMAYLNLLYRREVDVVATKTERENLLKMADDLIDKVKEIKQRKASASPDGRP